MGTQIGQKKKSKPVQTSRARFELAALFQVRKKKSCAESKKRSYPPKISWGIHFWVFLTSKLYFMRSERFQNRAGKCSICYCAPVKKSEKKKKRRPKNAPKKKKKKKKKK